MGKSFFGVADLEKILDKDLCKLFYEPNNQYIAAVCISFASQHEILFISWLNKNKDLLKKLASGKDLNETN